MSETTSTILQGGGLGLLLLCMGWMLRSLLQELRTVQFQLQSLETKLLRGAGLPPVPPPLPGQGETLQ